MPAPALPPGPDVGVLAQTALYVRDPLGVLRRCQARFGDVFTLRPATARPLVVVADPEAAERLAQGDPDVARAGEARRRVLPLASARSSFGADAPHHGVARGRLEGAFAPARLDARRAAMAALATRHAEGWPRGRPFRLLPRMRAVVDEITVRHVLGEEDDARVAAVVRAMDRMLWTPGTPPMTIPGEGDGLAGAAGKRVFDRRHAPLTRLLVEAVERRRRDGAAGEDALAALARSDLDARAAVDELLPVLMAAQEPAASALTSVLGELARRPELAGAVAREGEGLPGYDDVVNEVLRLRPAASGLLRTLREPVEAAGRVLPAGVTTMVPLPLVQRDPRRWDAPDDFRPGRWSDGARRGLHRPFGAGARRCLGEPLAHAQMAAVVPAVLRAVRLAPGWPRPEHQVLRATILVGHRSTPVLARAR